MACARMRPSALAPWLTVSARAVSRSQRLWAAGRQVLAAGFTIAPLQPRFTGGGASGECLVTLVLKVNDLGGWLSAPPLGALLAPWLRRVLAEAAAGAVIALRDKARRPGAPPGRRQGARHGAQRVGCRSARACGTPRGS